MKINASIRQFCKGYFATSTRSPHTRRAYASDLDQFAKFVQPQRQLASVRPNDIEGWAGQLKERGYAPASMKRKLATIRVFFRYWIRQGVVSTSPLSQIRINFGPTRQLPRYLTQSEMASLLEVAHNRIRERRPKGNGGIDRGFIALRNLAILRLLFSTGIRVGEAASLNVNDFCTDDNSFRILGKGGRLRLAFLTAEPTIEYQRQYLRLRQATVAKTNALFLNSSGGRLSTQGIAYALRSLAEAASLSKRVTPHMIRHTAATFLLRNGADLRMVQEFLGHASIATTQRYTHVTKEDLLSTLRRFRPGLALQEEAPSA